MCFCFVFLLQDPFTQIIYHLLLKLNSHNDHCHNVGFSNNLHTVWDVVDIYLFSSRHWPYISFPTPPIYGSCVADYPQVQV